MKNIYSKYLVLREKYSSLVLATVTGSRGSTPQKPGSTALFGPAGLEAGTVGGGVTEGRIMEFAAEAVTTKKSGLYEFNLSNNIENKYEAICGGYITILLDAAPGDSLGAYEAMQASLDNNRSGVLVTGLSTLPAGGINIKREWVEEGAAAPALPPDVRSAADRLTGERDPAGFEEIRDRQPGIIYYLQPFFPSEKLIIAGAGHIGRSLAHLASFLDFEVTVTDDRSEYACRENIPDADHIVVMDVGEALDRLGQGENTYVVIVTRGHRDDALALKPLIGRKLKYVGMIGSRTKIAAMHKDFTGKGWATEEQWSGIHTPIGLPIGSQTVNEIAVSIAAELVAVRRRSVKRTTDKNSRDLLHG